MSDKDPVGGQAAAPAEDRFATVPVEIAVHIGTARLLFSDLLAMEEDIVLPLDRSIDDPVELFIGGRLVARGDLEELGEEGSGRLGIRVTEIVPSGASRS